VIFIVPFILILNELFPANGVGIWSSFICSEVCTLVMILIASRRIADKTNVKGILLMDVEEDVLLDISIKTKIEEASAISQKVIEFCTENGMEKKRADIAGLAVEEMAANTILYGYKNKANEYIDILVRIQKSGTIIRIRDNGIPFNPLDYNPAGNGDDIEYQIGGINILKKMVTSSEYSRALGFNNLIIKI